MAEVVHQLNFVNSVICFRRLWNLIMMMVIYSREKREELWSYIQFPEALFTFVRGYLHNSMTVPGHSRALWSVMNMNPWRLDSHLSCDSAIESTYFPFRIGSQIHGLFCLPSLNSPSSGSWPPPPVAHSPMPWSSTNLRRPPQPW